MNIIGNVTNCHSIIPHQGATAPPQEPPKWIWGNSDGAFQNKAHPKMCIFLCLLFLISDERNWRIPNCHCFILLQGASTLPQESPQMNFSNLRCSMFGRIPNCHPINSLNSTRTMSIWCFWSVSQLFNRKQKNICLATFKICSSTWTLYWTVFWRFSLINYLKFSKCMTGFSW